MKATSGENAHVLDDLGCVVMISVLSRVALFVVKVELGVVARCLGDLLHFLRGDPLAVLNHGNLSVMIIIF